jgi:hypothetical protein
MTAFPLHVWAILLIMMDVSWVAERTDYWDAMGVAAYGLVFVLLESVLIWGVLIFVGYLLPKTWSENQRIVLLGVYMTVTVLWAVYGQLNFLLGWSFPKAIILFLAGRAHPLWFLYWGYFILAVFTVLLGTYVTIFSKRFQSGFIEFADRLSTLVGLYLFFDVVGLIFVLIRNLG